MDKLHCCRDVNEKKKPPNKKSGYLGLLKKFLETLGYVWFMMTCDHRLSCTMDTSTSCQSSNMPYKNNEFYHRPHLITEYDIP